MFGAKKSLILRSLMRTVVGRLYRDPDLSGAYLVDVTPRGAWLNKLGATHSPLFSTKLEPIALLAGGALVWLPAYRSPHYPL